MKFKIWVDDLLAGTDTAQQTFFESLVETMAKTRDPGDCVTVATLRNAYRGMRITHYGKAKSISLATREAVSITELCE